MAMPTSSPAAGTGLGLPRTIFDDVHHDFRASVRSFLIAEALPHTERWEETGLVDREFFRKAAAQGMIGFMAPEEYGGTGVEDFRFNVVIEEECSYTGAVGDNLNLTNSILAPYMLDLTTDEQKARWVPRWTTGDLIPAVCMTEPGAGSDLRGIASTARWTGDHYVLNGSKTFVTSGIQADLVIVAANVVQEGVKGLGLFAVEAGTDGFTRGRKLAKAGRKAQDTAELFFSDVIVPPENVLGVPGEGLRNLMANLAQERLSMAVGGVAASERALEITLNYVRDRKAFGQPIGSFQANKFALAELAAEIGVGRVYVDRCIEEHVNGRLSATNAAAAKLWATELQGRVMDRCLQLHGGYGYMDEYEISRLWRDARVTRIYGGTSEIMKEIVGRSLSL
jgi:alkylation response protein AidB-like acyl-CoA dehydrogenase